MDATADPLASAKAELAPLIKKNEFFVFVFGPALPSRAAAAAPKCSTSSHEKVIRHAKYLRRRVKEALEAEGFTADYGESPSILKFWRKFLSSPNDAVSEILQARRVCGAIVIFPASFGSLAELCLFARQGSVAEKTVAMVHQGYHESSSFFRRGVIEVFESFSGTTKFIDYANETKCVERVLSFVEGRYHRVLDELDQGRYIRARHRGHVFESKTKYSTD